MYGWDRIALIAASVSLALTLASASASAQVDLSGSWRQWGQQDSRYNPHVGELAGMPLNAEGINRAETYDQSILSLPEQQCRPHTAAYVKRDPSNLQIRPVVDPVTREMKAWQMEWYRNVALPVYMDGRPHPSKYAPHTWLGFSTAEWEGDKLRIKTTHIKEEWLRRNGGPHSDRTELVEYVIKRRFHDVDYLTWLIITYDPVYLAEPLVRSQEYQEAPHQRQAIYDCTPVTEVLWPENYVPYFLPGENDEFTNFAEAYGLPKNISYNAHASMYPEFRFALGDAATSAARSQGALEGGLIHGTD